jgi:hypothetical protein
MRARYIKIIVWVIALIIVWNLGQTYTVANSLFVFAAAGVIPGTNIALNPNQVLVCLASVLGASILLIFSTNIYRGLRRIVLYIKARPAVAVAIADAETEAELRPILAGVALAPVVSGPTIAEEVAKPKKKAKKTKAKAAPKPAPVIVIKQPKQPSKTLLLLHVASTLIGMLVRTTSDGARKHFPRLAAAFARVGNSIKRVIGHELQLLATGLALCAVGIARAARATGRFIARTSVNFWRWLEPRLRSFDAWLGVHYNRGLQTGRARVQQSNSYRAGMRGWRRALRLLAGMRDDLRSALARTPEE